MHMVEDPEANHFDVEGIPAPARQKAVFDCSGPTKRDASPARCRTTNTARDYGASIVAMQPPPRGYAAPPQGTAPPPTARISASTTTAPQRKASPPLHTTTTRKALAAPTSHRRDSTAPQRRKLTPSPRQHASMHQDKLAHHITPLKAPAPPPTPTNRRAAPRSPTKPPRRGTARGEEASLEGPHRTSRTTLHRSKHQHQQPNRLPNRPNEAGRLLWRSPSWEVHAACARLSTSPIPQPVHMHERRDGSHICVVIVTSSLPSHRRASACPSHQLRAAGALHRPAPATTASALPAGTTGLRALAVHVRRLTTLTRHRLTTPATPAPRRIDEQNPNHRIAKLPLRHMDEAGRHRTIMAARGGQAPPQSRASTRIAPVLRYFRGRTVAAARGAKRQSRISMLITDAEVHGDAHPSSVRIHGPPTCIVIHRKKKNNEGKK
ncbi:hypothetical protein C8J57DRAFT_1588845 [Mycena rebaudengoi]|nr:hypothetical protein C8J57DRAFT_1588845 [Mycena rebaudengoi]